MRVEKLGDGEPEYTIVGSIHGDEPCGPDAIERFLDEDWKVKKPVQFIIANEKALKQDDRYVEWDLNRSFPGEERSNIHEERLAAEILEKVRGTKVLDIHSTKSYPEPFSTFSRLNSTTLQLMKSAGVKNAVYFPSNVGSLNENVDGIVVEAGRQGTEQVKKNAYQVIINFLAAEGVIEAEFERSDPEIFKYIGEVEGGDWKFVAENFELVKEGEVFARRGDEELVAEQDFYPVLMSTNGYENILGNKARKIEKEKFLNVPSN